MIVHGLHTLSTHPNSGCRSIHAQTSKTSSKPLEEVVTQNTSKPKHWKSSPLWNQNAEWSVWPPRVLPTHSVLAGEAPPPGRFIAVQEPPACVLHRLLRFRREEGKGDCDIWANRLREEPARYRARQAAQWRNHQRRFCPGLEKFEFKCLSSSSYKNKICEN